MHSAYHAHSIFLLLKGADESMLSCSEFNWGAGVLLVCGLSVAYLVTDITKPQVPTDVCGSIIILRLAITVLDIDM